VVVLDVVQCIDRSAAQWFSWCSAVIDAVVVAVLLIGAVAVAQFDGGSRCAVQWLLYNVAVYRHLRAGVQSCKRTVLSWRWNNSCVVIHWFSRVVTMGCRTVVQWSL
jgi:hypothetical protein